MPSSLNNPGGAKGRTHCPARWWPMWPFLLVALLLLVWHYRPDLPGTPVAIDPLPSCASGRPQVVLVAADLSSSVIDKNGADSKGRSYGEIKRLAQALINETCTSEDRFGAIFFAGDAVELPPTLVSSQSIIERTLRRPPESEIGDSTNITRALDLAHQVDARFPHADTTVVMLSDMRANDEATTLMQLETIDPEGLHLVALGNHEPRFDRFFDTVVRLDDVEDGEVAEALHAAISHTRISNNQDS